MKAFVGEISASIIISLGDMHESFRVMDSQVITGLCSSEMQNSRRVMATENLPHDVQLKCGAKSGPMVFEASVERRNECSVIM